MLADTYQAKTIRGKNLELRGKHFINNCPGN